MTTSVRSALSAAASLADFNANPVLHPDDRFDVWEEMKKQDPQCRPHKAESKSSCRAYRAVRHAYLAWAVQMDGLFRKGGMAEAIDVKQLYLACHMHTSSQQLREEAQRLLAEQSPEEEAEAEEEVVEPRLDSNELAGTSAVDEEQEEEPVEHAAAVGEEMNDSSEGQLEDEDVQLLASVEEEEDEQLASDCGDGGGRATMSAGHSMEDFLHWTSAALVPSTRGRFLRSRSSPPHESPAPSSAATASSSFLLTLSPSSQLSELLAQGQQLQRRLAVQNTVVICILLAATALLVPLLLGKDRME